MTPFPGPPGMKVGHVTSFGLEAVSRRYLGALSSERICMFPSSTRIVGKTKHGLIWRCYNIETIWNAGLLMEDTCPVPGPAVHFQNARN